MNSPSHWPEVRIGDTLVAKYGKALPKANRHPGGIPVYGSNGVVDTHDRAITSGKTIIIGRKGSSGEVNFSSTPCWPIDTAYYIDDPGPFKIEFLFLVLQSLGLTEVDRSTAIPGLSREQLYEITIPLPPPAEQDQIVAALDLFRSHQAEAGLNIARAHYTIERYRQSILSAACSGRLTADWRALHGADVRDPGQRLTEDSELPAEWTRATVEELAEPGAAVSYGIVKPGPEVPGGVPYVRQQDIIDGTVLVDQLAHTSTELASKHQRTALRAGDVLLCIIRNLRVAIVPPGIDGANITQGMVRIRPGNRVLGEYLAYYLSAPSTQQRMRAQYVGLAMPRINVRDARELYVDVPPLDEQREIVNRVRQLFLLADELQQCIDTASRRVDLTMQAILAKAFRGELVPSA